MRTVILCAMIPILWFLAVNNRPLSMDDLGSIIEAFLILAFFGAVSGNGLALLIGATIVPNKQVKHGPTRLAAMRSADSLNGTFMLGCGSISSGMAFNFYKVDDDGSLVPESVKASGLVHIVEDEHLRGEGFRTTTMQERDRSSPFFRWAFCPDPAKVLRDEFRVPKGTVVHAFNLGA